MTIANTKLLTDVLATQFSFGVGDWQPFVKQSQSIRVNICARLSDSKLNSINILDQKMATSVITNFKTVAQFTVNTENLGEAIENTPGIVLSDIIWRVRFGRNQTGGDQKTETLSVHLVSESKQKDENWSCEAQARFKLYRKDDQVAGSVVKYLNKIKFDNDNSCQGINDFISWNDLEKHYALNNEVTFEIEISTSPLKQKRKHECINPVSVNFNMNIKDVSKLISISSPEVRLQGIRWNIRCSKKEDYLAVDIYSEGIDVNWSYRAEVSFTLLSMKSESMHLKKSFSKQLDTDYVAWGIKEFLIWTELVGSDKNYVTKDNANLFVELKVEDPVPRWKIMRHTFSKAELTIECCICLERFPSGNIFSIKCGHLFCKPCFTKVMANRKECPTCNVATSSAQLHPIYFG